MIIVECGLKKDFIVDLLTLNPDPSGIGFTHVSTEGIVMRFEVAGGSEEEAVILAKKLIKDSEFGQILYFVVRRNT
jgi:hypothetical protein